MVVEVERGSRGGAWWWWWWWTEVGEGALFIFFLDKIRASSTPMQDCHQEWGIGNTACGVVSSLLRNTRLPGIGLSLYED